MKLKKKIMLVVSMAIMTLSIVLSDMQVYAANNTYYVDYPEPMTDSNSGYCVVELQGNGQKYINVYFWYMYFMKAGGDEGIVQIPTDCGMEITVTHDSITFQPMANPSFSLGFCNLMMYNSTGILRSRWNENDGNLGNFSYNYKSLENMQITGLFFKGNIIECIGYDYSYTNPFVIFNSSESALALQQILNVLLRMDTRDAQVSSLLQTYIPRLSNIDSDLDVLLDLTENIIDELSDANSTLNSIDSISYNTLIELKSLHTTIKNQSSTDKNVTDGFKQDSDSQSSQLDNLNQQSQPDKIDVNNASGVVDQNLNINTDANYGVLLSTFTSNGKILTMLLAVSSIGLISYVLFGKR